MANGVIKLPDVIVTPDQPNGGQGSTGGAGGSLDITSQGLGLGGASATGYPMGAASSRYFDSYNYPPFLNRAVVIINGETYYEWESVSVHLTIGDPPPTFELTVSEQEPWPADWAFLRIRPPDQCAVILDGQLAITGWVITRQVYYDAHQHSVQIQGMGQSGILGHSTADTGTNEMKNLPPMQIIQKIAGAAGVPVAMAGSMPQDKIERFNITPGQSAREAIEEVSRAGNLMLGETKHGELLLVGPGAIGPGGGSIIEGRDILIGQELIHSLMDPGEMNATSQRPGNDDVSGSDAAQQNSQDSNHQQFSMGMPQRILSELPASSISQLMKRARIERNIDAQNEVFAYITVLGWQKIGGGGLWTPGDRVFVDAPMLILEDSLIIKSVTFTQDNTGGTRSRLELVNETAFSQAEPK